MKLNLVPARQGALWARRGVRTFFRQPLALSGLFFMFLALASILSLIPIIGNLVALVLLPGITAGFMAASRQAHNGRFPMPWVLLAAFRQGKASLQAMLTLGALYAAAIVLAMSASALLDGGQFASIYLLGGNLTENLLKDDSFLQAALLATALYTPISLLFWHAPALVHWHGITPVKSVFFSFMACRQNLGAFFVYGLTWIGLSMATGLVVATIGRMLGDASTAAAIMMPTMMLIAAMFFTSQYFTFSDSFDLPNTETP